MATFSYHLDQELTMLHSTIIAINESLLTLDTAMQTAARGPETALKPVREATTYAISLIQSLYPLIVSMKGSVQTLSDA
jgi:hypothetical protein